MYIKTSGKPSKFPLKECKEAIKFFGKKVTLMTTSFFLFGLFILLHPMNAKSYMVLSQILII